MESIKNGEVFLSEESLCNVIGGGRVNPLVRVGKDQKSVVFEFSCSSWTTEERVMWRKALENRLLVIDKVIEQKTQGRWKLNYKTGKDELTIKTKYNPSEKIGRLEKYIADFSGSFQ